ncbi:MAG TPA: hypothetical protein PLE77_09010 [Kiritimatiellia bacterium]|nr:hypothetical protein [Kiritimatiellia bacterium]
MQNAIQTNASDWTLPPERKGRVHFSTVPTEKFKDPEYAGLFDAVVDDISVKRGVERAIWDRPNEIQVRDEMALLLDLTGPTGDKYLVATFGTKLSSSTKSTCYAWVTGILGRPPTPGFDLRTLKGVRCRALITMAQRRDGTGKYCRVDRFLPVDRGTSPISVAPVTERRPPASDLPPQTPTLAAPPEETEDNDPIFPRT